MSVTRNPYRTAPGSDPPELAGRSGELGAARYAIDMAAAGEPPKPIVFTGLRGMGKTALLRRVANDVRAAGGIAILGEADRSLAFGDVMRRELAAALGASRSLPVRLRSAIRALVDRLPRISYEFGHDAGALSVEAGTSGGNDDASSNDSLEDIISVLNDRLHDHGRFLALGLDELQEARPDDLLRIIRVTHKTAGTNRPILFVGAGLPNSSAILKSVRTYTERWAFYRLELLGASDTVDAVDVPARALGVTWDAEAAREIFDRSLGYPYFLQEYASATWLRRGDDRIVRSDVLAIAPGVERMLDESVYDRQFAGVTPREAAYVLALHELGAGAHHSEEIASSMSLHAADLSSVRSHLIKREIIYAPARGLAEFRMPLTNAYIRRKEAFFRKRISLTRGGR